MKIFKNQKSKYRFKKKKLITCSSVESFAAVEAVDDEFDEVAAAAAAGCGRWWLRSNTRPIVFC